MADPEHQFFWYITMMEIAAIVKNSMESLGLFVMDLDSVIASKILGEQKRPSPSRFEDFSIQSAKDFEVLIIKFANDSLSSFLFKICEVGLQLTQHFHIIFLAFPPVLPFFFISRSSLTFSPKKSRCSN